MFLRFQLSLLFLTVASTCLHADLVVDSSQSSTTITVLGQSDTSQTSGTIQLATTPLLSPFDTAQIFEMDLTLDEGLNFDLLGGLVSINSGAGEINVQLLSPGDPGDVVAGEFDQLGNTIGVSGVMNVIDPLNLVGGSGPFDLGSLGDQTFDFNDVLISAVGENVTIDASYSITDTVNGVEVTVEGRVVASGTVAIPEPGSLLISGSLGILFCCRRKR